MTTLLSRRMFALGIPAGASVLSLGRALGADAGAEPQPQPSVPEFFPGSDPALVAKAVGLAHRDLAGVRELVDAFPALALASYDWGFGDWESPLGAASHTGQREIAEYLISMGARPDLFTYAMLGDLSVVKAICEADPAHRGLTGPHGISLLRHALAGGERAKPVAEYLESLGDADPRYADEAVSAESKRDISGRYNFGPHERDAFEIGEGMGGVTIRRSGGSARRLFRQPDGSFHPAGAPRVRINVDSGKVIVNCNGLTVVGIRAP